MKKYKIYFTIIVLFFSCSTLFGQKGIDCGFLEQVLKDPNLLGHFGYIGFDTIYVYEEDSIKYFSNCNSHFGKEKIFILINEIPRNYNINRCRVLYIVSVRTEGENIEIVFINGRRNNIPISIVRLTYRNKKGKYKLIGSIVS